MRGPASVRCAVAAVLISSLCPPLLPAADAGHDRADPGRPRLVAASKQDTSPPLLRLAAQVVPGSRRAKPELAMPPGVNRLPEGWRGATADRRSAHAVQTTHGARGPMPAWPAPMAWLWAVTGASM